FSQRWRKGNRKSPAYTRNQETNIRLKQAVFIYLKVFAIFMIGTEYKGRTVWFPKYGPYLSPIKLYRHDPGTGSSVNQGNGIVFTTFKIDNGGNNFSIGRSLISIHSFFKVGQLSRPGVF